MWGVMKKVGWFCVTKETSCMKYSNLVLKTSINISIPNHILNDEDYIWHPQSHFKPWTFGLFSWEKKIQTKNDVLNSKISAIQVSGTLSCYI